MRKHHLQNMIFSVAGESCPWALYSGDDRESSEVEELSWDVLFRIEPSMKILRFVSEVGNEWPDDPDNKIWHVKEMWDVRFKYLWSSQRESYYFFIPESSPRRERQGLSATTPYISQNLYMALHPQPAAIHVQSCSQTTVLGKLLLQWPAIKRTESSNIKSVSCLCLANVAIFLRNAVWRSLGVQLFTCQEVLSPKIVPLPN